MWDDLRFLCTEMEISVPTSIPRSFTRNSDTTIWPPRCGSLCRVTKYSRHINAQRISNCFVGLVYVVVTANGFTHGHAPQIEISKQSRMMITLRKAAARLLALAPAYNAQLGEHRYSNVEWHHRFRSGAWVQLSRNVP